MSRVRHILVAVDQFPQSKTALARAVELARAHIARLTIVHIAGEFGAPGAQNFELIEGHLAEEQALTLARERVEDAIRTHDLGRATAKGSALSRTLAPECR